MNVNVVNKTRIISHTFGQIHKQKLHISRSQPHDNIIANVRTMKLYLYNIHLHIRPSHYYFQDQKIF